MKKAKIVDEVRSFYNTTIHIDICVDVLLSAGFHVRF